MYYNLFIHFLMDIWVVYSLANADNDSVDITVLVFVWTYVCISLGYQPRSVIAGSYG